jgi:hypothetical protein
MKKRMPKQDERKVNMTTTLFLRENGAVTMSIVQKEGSFREVWKIDGLGENRKDQEWHYPCQNAKHPSLKKIPNLLVNPDFKLVVVTLGATGRVLDGFRVWKDSVLFPPHLLPRESPRLLNEYYGKVIPSEVQYMWWDDSIEPPCPPLYEMMGDRFAIWPLLLVTAHPRKCIVVDITGVVRRVVFGKQDTYRQFVNNGVSKWHAVSPDKVELYMNNKLIPPLANDGSPNSMWEVTSLFSPQGVHPVLYCQIRK